MLKKEYAENEESVRRIAVLIDAENAQQQKMQLILSELSARGTLIVKRAYGDFSSEALKKWKKTLNELVIQPIQQFAYTQKKNSSDITLVIDAMDLLYSGKIDSFALISSDSDFTKLASRLREGEKYVIGVGERKTPEAFRNACDDFIFTDTLVPEELGNGSSPESDSSGDSGLQELKKQLVRAYNDYQDEDGWTNVGAAGSYVQRVNPALTPKNFGHSTWTKLIDAYPEEFELRRLGKGNKITVKFRTKMKRKVPVK
ncbi:MAG: NYN domain-containing protein [Lachnoclostridium sp.]|jgi:uncharacterized protein (TIGR00288 family)|nr:NYN domain-containing protein [Lachnoclostridium sp.]